MEQRPVVLCVDDDTEVLSALRLALSAGLDRRVQLELAHSGAEALQLAHDLQAAGERVQVVVSDYIMPGMNGDALLIQLHQRDPAMVKILLTGQSHIDGVKRVINEATLFRFMDKPFDNTDLVMTVATALESYRQARLLQVRTDELQACSAELAQINGNLEQMVIERTAALTESNRQWARQATTDSLTQLCNRAQVATAIGDAQQRLQRYGTPVSLIMVNLDAFHKINDIHGQAVGDAVLVEVAQVLSAQVREADTVGRWGGDEFMLVCPEIALEQARAVAEKLRQALVQRSMPESVAVTASVGVAQLQVAEPLRRCLSRLAKAVASSKAAGGNRVTSGLQAV